MRFLVVGDSMIDRYWIGKIRRLNPEKHSAPLLSHYRTVDRPGGAANVAANVSAMGATAVLVSQKYGAIVKNRLVDEDEGIVARFDYDQECERVDRDLLKKSAEGCCAVVVSDYGKGAIDQDICDDVRALSLPTFADVKVRPDRWAEWCVAMFPNESEFIQHRKDYELSKACIVKRGANGAHLFSRNVPKSHFSSMARAVMNVTGAGDTVIAAYATSHMAIASAGLIPAAKTQDMPVAIAMDFAGKAVSTLLTHAPSFVEVYGDPLPAFIQLIVEELRK